MTQPKNHRTRWSESDDAKLRMMLEHQTPIEEIATHLQRTPGTVQWRRWFLRLADAADEIHDELANETAVILPHDSPDDFGPLNPRKSPIEMVERTFLWGLFSIVRFKYAGDM